MITVRVGSRQWRRIRAAVLQRQPLCVHCLRVGRHREADEVDHIRPRHKGGGDEAHNLQGLCVDCHERKTAQEARIHVKPCERHGWPADPRTGRCRECDNCNP